MVNLVRLPIVALNGGDIVLLARRHGQASRLLESGRALLEHRRTRWLPERIVDAHGDAPVAHRTARILRRDRGERLLRLLVPEGVQERDGALEVVLDGGRARDGEVHAAEL